MGTHIRTRRQKDRKINLFYGENNKRFYFESLLFLLYHHFNKNVIKGQEYRMILIKLYFFILKLISLFSWHVIVELRPFSLAMREGSK